MFDIKKFLAEHTISEGPHALRDKAYNAWKHAEIMLSRSVSNWRHDPIDKNAKRFLDQSMRDYEKAYVAYHKR